MTVTQVELKTETQELISNLVEENYAVDDIYEFIEEFGEGNFVQNYEKYVELGESHSYGAVDAFIEEFGIWNLNSFEDSYRGVWRSKEQYAKNYMTDCYFIECNHGFIVIDWEETFNNLDCTFAYGFVFCNQF